jgi:O-succinylbenzoic acid--CoA ligase
MPLFHVGGLSILLRSALDAVPVVLHERFDPEAVSRSLDEDAITTVSLVPTMLSRLLDVRDDGPPPATLRCVLLGGGAASAQLVERAATRGWPLAPTYGLTEAASQVATLRPGGDPLTDGLEPLAGTEVRILSVDGGTADPGEPGEILVRGPTVMAGYVERPEQTRLALRDGWLHTGDVGSVDERGRLHVYERRSDLIISGGENVYPAEVETVLQEHPAVIEAGVAGIPDPDFGHRPAAWLVVKPGERISDAELTRFCRERLAGYKIPVRYHRTDALPRTASGKLQRSDLPAPRPGRTAPRGN